MNRTLKTVITVCVCTICILISLCALGYCYYITTEPMEYESGYSVMFNLKDAVLERFDHEEYQDYQKDGYEIYKLYLTVENYGNKRSLADALYLYYMPTDSYGMVSEFGRLYFDEDENVLPPGKESVISRVLYVPEGCGEIQIKYSNYRTNEEQLLKAKVP